MESLQSPPTKSSITKTTTTNADGTRTVVTRSIHFSAEGGYVESKTTEYLSSLPEVHHDLKTLPDGTVVLRKVTTVVHPGGRRQISVEKELGTNPCCDSSAASPNEIPVILESEDQDEGTRRDSGIDTQYEHAPYYDEIASNTPCSEDAQAIEDTSATIPASKKVTVSDSPHKIQVGLKTVDADEAPPQPDTTFGAQYESGDGYYAFKKKNPSPKNASPNNVHPGSHEDAAASSTSNDVASQSTNGPPPHVGINDNNIRPANHDSTVPTAFLDHRNTNMQPRYHLDQIVQPQPMVLQAQEQPAQSDIVEAILIPNPLSNKKWKLLRVGIAAAVIIAVGIAIGVVVSKNKSTPDSQQNKGDNSLTEIDIPDSVAPHPVPPSHPPVIIKPPYGGVLTKAPYPTSPKPSYPMSGGIFPSSTTPSVTSSFSVAPITIPALVPPSPLTTEPPNGEVETDTSPTASPKPSYSIKEDSSYSIPDSYDILFCLPAEGFNIQFCIAAECTEDPSCECDFYTQAIDSKEIVGVCNSCNICEGSLEYAFDCSNLFPASVVAEELVSNCSLTDPTLPSSPSPTSFSIPDGYDMRICSPINDTVKLCYVGECFHDSTCECVAYAKLIDNGEFMGVCDACSVCDGGGIKSNCTNLGYSAFDCEPLTTTGPTSFSIPDE